MSQYPASEPRSASSHDLARALPDGAYLAKVARRQAPFVLTMMVLIAPLAAIFAWQQGDRYTSSVSALYDDRDSIETAPRYPYFPSFAQVSEAFKTTMADTEFLWQVAQESGLSARASSKRPLLDRFRQYLPDNAPEGTAPTAESKDDSALKESLTRALKTALVPTFDDKKNTFGLTVTADDPVLARQLADAAMELFIQSELRFEAETLRRQHELFANYLHEQTRTDDAERHSVEGRKLDEKAVARNEEERLKDQEADLIDRIQTVKAEIDQEKSRAVGVRATVEADLARLATKLQPSHPDVIAKQEELRGLAREPDDRSLRSNLSHLRQELESIRTAERKLGMKVASGEGRDDAAQRGLFLPNLADRVHELSLLETALSRQAESPSLRTRLRVFAPATFDLSPRSRRVRMLMIALIAVGALVALTAGALREFRTPLTRDPWRVEAASQLPVLGTLDTRYLQSYKSISPQLATIMRGSSLSGRGRRGKAGAALQSYRRIELELQRRCQGQVVLLLNAGLHDKSAAFVENFLNIVAAETAGPLLLIDCDQVNPVATDQAFLTVPFAAFLSGKSAWKDVRLARSPERSFDLVAAPDLEAEAMIYKPDVLDKLFATLTKSYSRIFIRGHDASQVLANAALLGVATDCVLCLDGRATTFTELERSTRVASAAKLRGLIMIGT